ncbi:RNA polymerase sigma factor [Jannaschia sp. R86511]|uniref:RNA polymerase sigma factor n=1 Tax=Jannaschia sp. R86511 TaxID=3093853 RepID=UPI0036D21E7C
MSVVPEGSGPVAAAGDAGFDVEAAYRAHAGELFGFALNAVGDRGSAEDLVQDVFARAWRAGGRYSEGRGSVRTWLFGIARNLVVDVHRARSRRVRLVPVGEDGPEPVCDPPDEEVHARVQVVAALARLTPEHREVVVAVHLAGRTYQDLSAETGCSVATLRTRMHYGLKAMRTVMNDDERSPGGRA